MEETQLSGPSVGGGKRIAAVALKENEWISMRKLKDFIENKGKLTGIGRKWEKVKEDHDRFQRYKKMADEALELQKLGFEFFGIIAKPNSNLIAKFGSRRGKLFLEDKKICWEFASEINDKIFKGADGV
eukprot:gene14941-6086_t